jgi:hypothetical protein
MRFATPAIKYQRYQVVIHAVRFVGAPLQGIASDIVLDSRVNRIAIEIFLVATRQNDVFIGN